jgi:histidinol-phosphate aminotransferase
MNEGIVGLPDDFVCRVLSRITTSFLSQYPEIDDVVEKMAALQGLPPGNICMASGSEAAIRYVFDAYISPGDKVLLMEPIYASYKVNSLLRRARTETISHVDVRTFPSERFIAQIEPGTKIAVIERPNNPTGYSLPHDEIVAMLSRCEHCGTLLVVDEANSLFPSAALRQMIGHENLVVLNSFSKTCCLAAIRLGYAAANSRIVSEMRKVKPPFDVNGVAAAFARELLERPSIIADIVRRVEEGKIFLTSKLTSEGIPFVRGDANFLLVGCSEPDRVAQDLERGGILVRNGFKQPYLRDYIRVTIGDISLMTVFFDKLVQSLRAIAGPHH